MNNQQTYMFDLSTMTEAQWDQFQHLMDLMHDEQEQYCEKLTVELNISLACAYDVVYLRSRSRWTQALEEKLIQLHNEGNPPNIYEFG